MVMEYIEFTSAPVPDLPERVARAVQWLFDCPAPKEFTIGPLGGARARHPIFKDYIAPLSFSNIEALEAYMNKALERIPLKSRPSEVRISHESLVFTQSDMDVSNFGVDKNGKTCLFDFELIGLLPQSFAIYNMFSNRPPFTTEVVRHLDWQPTPNMSAMRRIRGILWVLADPALGLKQKSLPRLEH